jgi:hypothetical protein
LAGLFTSDLALAAANLVASEKSPAPRHAGVFMFIGAVVAMLVAYLLWRRFR